MAAEIRPSYQTKLRYALRAACVFWLSFPAVFVMTLLSLSHYRWVTFEVIVVGGTICTSLIALLWAAQSADIPRPEITWRAVWRTSLVLNIVVLVFSVTPYFRYTYVHVGNTIVRVDRLTGTQCLFPPNGCEEAPYDPIMRYDQKTSTWRAAPGGLTVRDYVLKHKD